MVFAEAKSGGSTRCDIDIGIGIGIMLLNSPFLAWGPAVPIRITSCRELCDSQGVELFPLALVRDPEEESEDKIDNPVFEVNILALL